MSSRRLPPPLLPAARSAWQPSWPPDPWLVIAPQPASSHLDPTPTPADIGQFHTWLLTKRADGQPIYLLTLLPGYPLLNFALVTAGAH